MADNDTPLDLTELAKSVAGKSTGTPLDAVAGIRDIQKKREKLDETSGKIAQATITENEKARQDVKNVEKEHPFVTPEFKPFEQKMPENDPVKSFGSWASALGILASALTKTPLTSALNASAAAIHAVRANDLAAYEDARKSWKEGTDLAIKQAEWENKRYDHAMSLADKDHTLALSSIQALAAEQQDHAMSLVAQTGDFAKIGLLQDSRQRLAMQAKTEQMRWDEFAQEKQATLETAARVKEMIAPAVEAAQKAGRPLTQQQVLALQGEARDHIKQSRMTTGGSEVERTAAHLRADDPNLSFEASIQKASELVRSKAGRPLTEGQRIKLDRDLTLDESHLRAIDSVMDKVRSDRTGILTKYAKLPFSKALAQMGLGAGEIAQMNNELKLLQATLKHGNLKSEWEARAGIFDIGSPTAAVLDAIQKVRDPLQSDYDTLKRDLGYGEGDRKTIGGAMPTKADPLGIR